MKTMLEMERIRSLDQIFGLDEYVAIFRGWNHNHNHPHQLHSGPPGTGKSSSVEGMLRDYYGDTYNYNVVKINASKKSERSIANIESIISKMKVQPVGDFPYRTFVFEEADQLTDDAEKALKEAMVEYSTNAKCVFITNEYHKMNDAIVSRCAEFEYYKQHIDNVFDHLEEKVTKHIRRYDTELTPEDVVSKALAGHTTVALRDAIKYCELVLQGRDPQGFENFIQDRAKAIIDKIFLAIKKGVSKKRLLTSTVKMYDEFLANAGHQERDLLRLMFENVKPYFEDHPLAVGYISMKFAKVDINLQNSSNPSIHIMSMLHKFTMKFGA